MTDINLRILLNAVKGNTTSVIGDVSRALGTSSSGLQGAMLGVSVAAAALAIGIGVKAVQAAAAYQSAMTQLQNTTGSTDAQMQQYTATIRELSDTTGKAQTDLAKGMYQIVSANFAGADATRILTTATQAAIIAGADQTQVTTGLVVTLNAFGLKANQVDSVSNRMFKTLSLGRGQMNDLAGALQTGGALVAHYGVSVTDMDATLATLSTGGMKTFGTSMTGLTQLLNVMDGKTDLITKRMHKLGITFDENKFQAMTYTQQIAYLSAAFQGHEKQMVAVLGSKQAATALGILGTQSTLLASNLKKLSDTQELAKEKTTAWSKVQNDFNFQWDRFKTTMNNVLITLGLGLLPVLTNIASQLIPLVQQFSQFVGWMQQGSPAAQAVGLALQLIGSTIATMAVASWVQGFVGGLAKIATQSGLTKVQVASDAVEEDASLATVAASADTASLSVKGIGIAALGAVGPVAAVAVGLYEIAKFLKDNHILPDAPKTGLPDWVTHQNASAHQAQTGLKDAIPSPTSISIPRHASGVTNFSGGLAYVHQGEVLSNLAPGTNVTPASRVSLGGHTFIINVSTMAGSRSEVMRMVDLMEAEIAARFRGQTPGFGFGGIV